MLRTLKFIWTHPIASTHRGAALCRYARWQLGTRLLATPCLIPFVESTQLLCERSMTGATGNLYCGLHEFGDMGFLLHYLRPGDLFVDVGANIGSFTMLASGVVGAESIALEPVPATLAMLRRNIAVNGIEARVLALGVAAGSARRRVRFSCDRGCQNAAVDERYRGISTEVPMVPLDEITTTMAPCLLKIDAEGADGDVIKGASDTLRNPTLSAVLVEGDSAAIATMMSDTGFARASYNPMTRSIVTRDGRPNRLPTDTRNNLWLRGVQGVQERCRTARTFTVYECAF